jgi:hypothetical protein
LKINTIQVIWLFLNWRKGNSCKRRNTIQNVLRLEKIKINGGSADGIMDGGKENENNIPLTSSMKIVRRWKVWSLKGEKG